jgi:hypothetical protein
LLSSTKSETRVREEVPITQVNEQDLVSLVRTVQDESVRIKELSDLERTYMADTIGVLRQFIASIGKSYHLDPTLLSRVDRNIADIVLTAQGSICLIYNNNRVVTRSLENLSSESLIRVLNQILPEIKISLVEKRQKLLSRAGLLEKVSIELKKIASDSGTPIAQTEQEAEKSAP